MKLLDIIKPCDDGRPTSRDILSTEGVAVHRIWFDDWPMDREYDPIEIARRFVDDPEVSKYTGRELPYTFLIDGAGVWWQCLALGDVGKHARRWSTPYIGVGVIGDFRKRVPTSPQRGSLVDGLAELMPALGIDPLATVWLDGVAVPRLAGHDELPGGSKDPDKRCPGPHLPMRDLRRDVAIAIERLAMGRLAEIGLVV